MFIALKPSCCTSVFNNIRLVLPDHGFLVRKPPNHVYGVPELPFVTSAAVAFLVCWPCSIFQTAIVLRCRGRDGRWGDGCGSGGVGGSGCASASGEDEVYAGTCASWLAFVATESHVAL